MVRLHEARYVVIEQVNFLIIVATYQSMKYMGSLRKLNMKFSATNSGNSTVAHSVNDDQQEDK